jgi:hypothetical protein
MECRERRLSRQTGGLLHRRPRKGLTKAKYRYIIARWGYSPSILAWELFNEVQYTDAARDKQGGCRGMAPGDGRLFARAGPVRSPRYDQFRPDAVPGLYDAADYVQPHAYPPDGVAAAQSLNPAAWKKPIFFGEIGPSGDLNADDGTFLHDTLWASLMSKSSGAAQYWTWDHIHRRDLYGHFAAAAGFVKASGLAEARDLCPAKNITVQTQEAGAVSFGPGGGWGQA